MGKNHHPATTTTTTADLLYAWYVRPRGGGGEGSHRGDPNENTKKQKMKNDSKRAERPSSGLSTRDAAAAPPKGGSDNRPDAASSASSKDDHGTTTTSLETHQGVDDGVDDRDADDTTAAPTVGVKQHRSKKSNAVGDPDGEGSSDDENNDDDVLSDWDDESVVAYPEAAAGSVHDDDFSALERVQVEVEYAVQGAVHDVDIDDDDELEPDAGASPSSSRPRADGGGGVGLRLGRRFQKKKARATGGRRQREEADEDRHRVGVVQSAAWRPHVYFPPLARHHHHWTYLRAHARATDADGKMRLDRRTLYAALLLEWTTTAAAGRGAATTTSTNTSTTTTTGSGSNGNGSARKFLDPAVAQALQAALSLATQPAWRQSLQRPSAIRLYGEATAESTSGGPATTAHRECTLAMQETIALALVRSPWLPRS